MSNRNIDKQNMSNYIQTEVTEMILSKLPAKSVKRFLTVSKEWYNSITSTHFVSIHLKFTNSLQDKTLLFVDFIHMTTHKTSYLLYSDNDKPFDEYAILRAPVEESIKNLGAFGCCNGLVCLSNFVQVILWNPSIQKSLHLPKSPIDLGLEWRFIFGFFFDHVNNDFKLLRHNFFEVQPMVEIFRLRTYAWELWTNEIPFRNICGDQVYLKGFAHWIGVDSKGKRMIISFDVHKEVFGSIEPPTPSAEKDETFLFLFEESLVLLNDVNDHHPSHRRRCDFWKMEEYGKAESWNLWHTIYYYYIYRIPLGFMKNGQFLWKDVAGTKFISTNLHNFSETCLGKYGKGIIYHYLNYVESLALLDTAITHK